MAIERIFPESSATPRGHYTPGMRAGDFIYVSGQGPIDPVSDELVVTDVATQTRMTLENVERVLAAAGASRTDIVKVSVFLRDISAIGRVLYRLSEAHKRTPMTGRTHVVQALPITFGHKTAIWLSEMGLVPTEFAFTTKGLTTWRAHG